MGVVKSDQGIVQHSIKIQRVPAILFINSKGKISSVMSTVMTIQRQRQRQIHRTIQIQQESNVGGVQSDQGFVQHSIRGFRHFTIDPTASGICWVAFNSTIAYYVLWDITKYLKYLIQLMYYPLWIQTLTWINTFEQMGVVWRWCWWWWWRWWWR